MKLNYNGIDVECNVDEFIEIKNKLGKQPQQQTTTEEKIPTYKPVYQKRIYSKRNIAGRKHKKWSLQEDMIILKAIKDPNKYQPGVGFKPFIKKQLKKELDRTGDSITCRVWTLKQKKNLI